MEDSIDKSMNEAIGKALEVIMKMSCPIHDKQITDGIINYEDGNLQYKVCCDLLGSIVHDAIRDTINEYFGIFRKP